MKRRYILWGAVIVIILIAVAGGYFASLPEKKEVNREISDKEERAVLIISNGEADILTFDMNIEENNTALDVLNKSGLAIEIKEYDFGKMVESIADKKNGDDGKYWLYYINGETPMVSADKYMVKPGDRIEYKFETSSF